MTEMKDISDDVENREYGRGNKGTCLYFEEQGHRDDETRDHE